MGNNNALNAVPLCCYSIVTLHVQINKLRYRISQKSMYSRKKKNGFIVTTLLTYFVYSCIFGAVYKYIFKNLIFKCLINKNWCNARAMDFFTNIISRL